jgi:hypothetical protein
MGWDLWKFRLLLRPVCGIISAEEILTQCVNTNRKAYLGLGSSSETTGCEGLDPIELVLKVGAVSFSASEDGEMVFAVALSSSLGSVRGVRALSAAATEGGRANACFIASISPFFLSGECRGGLGGGGARGSILKTAMGGGGSGPALACSPG